MEYLLYILAVLIIGLMCIAAIRFFGRRSESPGTDLKRRATPANRTAAGSRKADRQDAAARASASATIAREMQRTPTPWGWANHKAFNRLDDQGSGLSAAMQSITDRLLREKTLAGNGYRDSRTAESLRALLEDRYAPVNKDRMTEMEFTKVNRPLLRDPSEPHDQMDNLGTRNAERISTKLGRVVAPGPLVKKPARLDDDFRYVEVKDVKLPWGW